MGEFDPGFDPGVGSGPKHKSRLIVEGFILRVEDHLGGEIALDFTMIEVTIVVAEAVEGLLPEIRLGFRQEREKFTFRFPLARFIKPFLD